MIKMSDCQIIKVDNQDSTLIPKLVNFQNGQPRNTEKLQSKAFVDPKNNKTIVAIASNRLTYVGEENENDLFYTLLALRNKETNKVRIVPVNTVEMNVLMSKTNQLLDSSLNSTTRNVGDLYKQFGSKKSKRRTEQIERMKMNISNVEEELKSAVANVTVKEDDLVTQEVDENVADYRPNINRNASKVENVYDLYEIIEEDELNSLEDIANGIVENSVIDEELSKFAYECITKLKEASVTDLKKYEIILYCDAILKFFKVPTPQIRRKVKIAPYPEKIISKILREYTVFIDNSRHRPFTMRDKAVCYVIVLALIAMDYKLDLEPLTLSINTGINKLRQISRVLGAQFLSTKSKTTIILKLPLPAPVTGFSKTHRRK